MVLVEFLASYEKERKGSYEDAEDKSTPKAYDVFTVRASMLSDSPSLVVCMPMQKGKLCWWDGKSTNFWAMDSGIDPGRRVASLSGPARVLQSLSEASNDLSRWAMKREKLVAVDDEESRLLHSKVDPSIIASLNESQQKAVNTVISPNFQKGFFTIQGPPGCGKTTTMVAMISAIGEGVIVAAPSNAAVANLALKLHGTGRYDFGHMLVFGNKQL